METFSITANLRQESGRKTEKLREQGIVPGVMYGFETEPINLSVDRNALNRLYQEAGSSSVIELELNGEKHSVLIQDIQRDPLTDYIIHVDFRRINMNQKVETAVHIALVGESPAVKDFGGTLIHSLEEVEVSSLPSALVPELEVDISGLKTFDDVIRVGDLQVPEGMEILTAPDVTVALVQAPRTKEEMEALDEGENVEEGGEAAEEKDEGKTNEEKGE